MWIITLTELHPASTFLRAGTSGGPRLRLRVKVPVVGTLEQLAPRHRQVNFLGRVGGGRRDRRCRRVRVVAEPGRQCAAGRPPCRVPRERLIGGTGRGSWCSGARLGW